MDLKDYKLIKETINGDEASFEQLIDSYQILVYRTCLRFMKNHEDTQDMAQEVFVSVYKNIHKFKFKSSFSTWLHKICFNVCINQLKKQGRLITEDIEAIGELTVFNDPQKLIEEKETKEFIITELDKMNEKSKAVAKMRILGDRSFAEIAHILRIPQSSARTTYMRAKNMLRDRFAKYREE